MSKTLETLSTKLIAVKKQAEARQAECQDRRQAEATYRAAWNGFITACYLEQSNLEAGRAVVELARLITKRGRLARLQEVADAFSSRDTQEPIITAILLERIRSKVAPSNSAPS